ncbi:MAG: RnfABCDGE type electron transport complex subunit B [Proteobacteria bacterium]|jgi:RnfABCDGE-type electron transport complex B subunit|nr:RnfABCDGE type electron transport complex subunit B [Pseudomonadota bacterium]
MAELIDLINASLPQYQCGRCDTPGCKPYAQSIVDGAPHNRCVPGGLDTLNKLERLTKRATLPLDHDYGPTLPNQIARVVEEECIGCKKCIDACPVDAIVGAANLMHVVITDICTGCELCIEPCPVDCIDLVEIDEQKALIARESSQKYVELKTLLGTKRSKVSRLTKKNALNLLMGAKINSKIERRDIDQKSALQQLQKHILESQKIEKLLRADQLDELIKKL